MVKPELLAPAGDIDCFKAAIVAGADAIYLAGKRFGARAFASNFDEEGLKWVRKVSKANNKKLYITLNTIVFEHEWNFLKQTLDFMELLQPDSLIIQDIGIAVELKKRGSKIPLHLSTQGAWFGQGGIEELKDLGITRVILPRETSQKEISDIVKNSPFEIEVFVHGAMCYSISGRCFWSAQLGTRSGNRGTCAQPCRREYCVDKSNNYNCVFSPKDLRLINQIKPLIETGVTSLKIEGRMKSPEYVYQVVKAYRNAIDGEKTNTQVLDEVFSRKSSTGFFFGAQKASEWKTGNNPGREGIVVGITTGKKAEGLTELKEKFKINPGDGLFWFENNEQKGTRITFVKRDSSNKKTIWVRGLPPNILGNTEIRRTSKNNEDDWETKWNKNFERYPLILNWSGRVGSPLEVETVCNSRSLKFKTDELLSLANLKGLDEGPLQEKFNLIGEDFIVIENNINNLDKKLFISGSSLKSLKRLFLEKLLEAQSLPLLMINNKDRNIKNIDSFQNKENTKSSVEFYTSRLRLRLWNEIEFLTQKLNFKSFVIPWRQRDKLSNKRDYSEIVFWLPPILNFKHFNEIYAELKGLKSGCFICFGWEAFKLSKLLPQLRFELDWCFNISNISALEYIRKAGLDAILSKEWKIKDIPENLSVYRSNYSWNPLVSFTRFSDAVKPSEIIFNSHHDDFFTLPIGNGVTAMFLEKNIKELSNNIKGSYEFDIAVSPKEDISKDVEKINRVIKSFYK